MIGRRQQMRKDLVRNSRLVATALLLGVIFILGGSSRADYVPAIIVLALSAGYVAALAPIYQWRELGPIAVPLGLLAGMLLLCLLQLVPVPGADGRALFAATGAVTGTPASWRPLSLSPVSTWSVFAVLFVPFAALIALVDLPSSSRRFVVPTLLAAALFSALLGVVQSLSDMDSPLYYYEFTNRGSPVGVFANRNHQAVFLACGLVWAAYVFCNAPGRPSQARAVQWTAAGISIVLCSCVLANVSRAGLIALFLASIFALTLFIERLPSDVAKASPYGRAHGWRWVNIALPGVAAVSFACLLVVFFFQSKIPALDRILSEESRTGLRGDVTSTLMDMAGRNLPFGTGMGTFERAYRMAEPDSLLMPNYLNNAHNDWLQLVIEGGLPATALLCGAFGWIAIRLVHLFRASDASRQLAICVGGTIAILAVASTVDYPLRTPWMMTVAALLIGLLGYEIPNQQFAGRDLR